MHTTGRPPQLPVPVAHSPYSALPTQGLLTPPHLCKSSPNKLNQTPVKVQMTKASSGTPHKHSTPQAQPYWAILSALCLYSFPFGIIQTGPQRKLFFLKPFLALMIQKAYLDLLSLL